MKSIARRWIWIATAGLLAAACSTTSPSGPPAYGSAGSPQIFEGMGSYGRSVTTSSSEARLFFNQGLAWLLSFNHDEAVLSFSKAAELDPGCAMAWWGVAYAQGPNYNDPAMSPDRSRAAWEALQRALAALDEESEVERGLIEALTHRYAETPPGHRGGLDASFAKAMGELWNRFGDDPDVGTLYADSMMLRNPWKLYHSNGEPARPETLEILRVLEDVLAAHPAHPGANHLYIHAVEPGNHKAKAIPAADRLSGLVPGSGHMLHMPAHIYVQVGLWDRAIEQSRLAMACDDRYRALSPHQALQHGYMSHNSHMLAFAAMMVGREHEALAAARSMMANFPEPKLRGMAPFFDVTMCSVYDVLKRFGRWDALLAEPAPPEFLPVTTAVWRAHRDIAFAAKKQHEDAAAEQRLFRDAVRAVPVSAAPSYGYVLKFLVVSDLFVSAELALQKDRFEEAASLLEEAVLVEDTIGYGEPPRWLQPARHTLGVAYLKLGRFADAERVYRDDLRKWPRNGWALLGLSQALAGRGDLDASAEARKEFDIVWARADARIPSSCMCVQAIVIP